MRKLLIGALSISTFIALFLFGKCVPTDAKSMYTETTVIGNVSPTLIKVSAPAKIAFSINPNLQQENGRFNSSMIKIINTSNAPVKVKIDRGNQNFSLTNDSLWKPVNALPAAYHWDTLGTLESESYIALGVKVKSGEWRKIVRSDPLYAAEQNSERNDVEFGEIKSNSTGLLNLVCSHGLSFDQRKECTYRIIWAFSIGD